MLDSLIFANVRVGNLSILVGRPISPFTPTMRHGTRQLNHLFLLIGALLAGCSTAATEMAGAFQRAKPQVAYRIDSNRFFEIVPLKDSPCRHARLFYNDTALGVHIDVVSWDRISDGQLVIDAATDRFLVSPVILSSSSCHSGGGDLCAPSIAYSDDRGRSWKFAKPRLSIAHGPVLLVGDSIYYAGQRALLAELPVGDAAWKDYYFSVSGKPSVQTLPIDSAPSCNTTPQEGQ